MPTYQYRCKDCDELTEAVQKFTDPALTDCPHCGGPLHKVYNAVGVVFKGSGFYKTDSRAGGQQGTSGSGGASSSGTTSGDGSTSAATSDAGAKAKSPTSDGGGSAAASSTGPAKPA